MKLELKHLAPYQLHYLNCIYNNAKYEIKSIGIDHIQGVCGLFKNGLFVTRAIVPHIKPIFRPLSDLTKEIEVNGEKFIPFYKLVDHFKTVDNEDLDLKDVVSFEINKIKQHKSINQCEYWLVEKLFEWHFDVFGLIPEGLAIDINTLKS